MAFSVESHSYSLDVFHLATFCCEVSVALQCDVFALNFDDAMQYIVARTDFCQYRLTDIVYLAFGKQGFVALVFRNGRMEKPLSCRVTVCPSLSNLMISGSSCALGNCISVTCNVVSFII